MPLGGDWWILDAARELAHFASSGFRGDREGIAIYTLPDGTGYIVCTDQRWEKFAVFYGAKPIPGVPPEQRATTAVLAGNLERLVDNG